MEIERQLNEDSIVEQLNLLRHKDYILEGKYFIKLSSEEQKLQLIFTLIYSKVRSIQTSNNFDQAIEVEASTTYIEMDDNYFFRQSCDIIFQSGLRGAVWQKYEPQIRKEFSEYEIKKVARFRKKDVERILKNPKMLKNRKKIEACIHNAKTIVAISKEYNGFWKFLDSQHIEELVEKIKSNFKWMGYTNAYAFLRYVGMEVVKPDINVVRLMLRLGLVDSDKKSIETFKQVQEVGKKMAEANHQFI